MKSLIALFAIFCLPLAYAACPNMVGHWNCNTDGGSASSMDVTQEDIAGGTLYKVVNQEGEYFEYAADGVLRNVEDEDTMGSALAFCGGSSDIHSERETRAKDGSFKAIVIEDLNLARAGEIQSTAKTHLEYSVNVEEHEYKTVCRKN